jgi:hypothetical protein
MTESDIATRFLCLSQSQRRYVISSLAHLITVCARGAYAREEQGQEVTKKLHGFNELQHTVTGQLTHLLADDGKWYSDVDFVSILFDKARNEGIEAELIWALDFALGHLLPPANDR